MLRLRFLKLVLVFVLLFVFVGCNTHNDSFVDSANTSPIVSAFSTEVNSIYFPVVKDDVNKDGVTGFLLNLLLNVFDNAQIKFIAMHILLNFLVAVGVSIYQKTFAINKLWEVFGKKLLPMIGTYFTFDLIGVLLGGDLIPSAVFISIEAALLADLLNNLDKVPALKPILEYVPDFLKKLVALPPMEFVAVEPGTVVDLETANEADK